jgi:tetratricopeptide (TPR) repeat protein
MPAAILTASCFIAAGMTAQAQSKTQAESDAPGPDADAKTYVEFGVANGMRGDLDGAIKAFGTAIGLDPKYPPAYYDMGLAQSLQGKTDDALKSYGKAIAVDPNYLEAYNLRGNLKGLHGDYAGAIADFQQVIRINPNYPSGHYNLGHVYYFTGDLDKATAELDKALALDPKLALAYFIRGLARHAQGHNLEATSDFRNSLGLDFPDAAFWIYLSETEDGLGDAAKQDLSTALAMPQAFKPDDFPSAVGNFILGNLPQDQLLAKAAAAKPDDRDDYTCASWFYAGMVQRLNHNPSGARDCFSKAIATNSKGSEEYIEAKREMSTIPGL